MAKKKDEPIDSAPAELPDPEPPHEPEPVDVADVPAELPDHTLKHGSDSIVSNLREYHIRVGGQRYVHVGENAAGEWVYRPD